MTHTPKVTPDGRERSVTLSVRIPFSLAQRTDSEVAQGGGTASDLIRDALERELARRERRRETAGAA